MSWIKAANQIGKYEETHIGFRIYCTLEPKIKESIVEREDGLYKRIDFIKGWFVAIDKMQVRFEAKHISELHFKIEIEHMRRAFEKREGTEIVWK